MWVKNIDLDLLQEKVKNAILGIIANARGTEIDCMLSSPIEILKKMTCSKADKDKTRKCWDKRMNSNAARDSAFSGQETKVKSNAADVKVSKDTIDPKDDHKTVNVKSADSNQ